MTVRRNKLWILSFAIVYFCPTLCLARNLDSSGKLDLLAVTPRSDPNESTSNSKRADVSNAKTEDVASRNIQPEVPISKPEVEIDGQNVTAGNETDEYESDYSEEDYEYEVNGTEGDVRNNLAYKSNLDSNATGLTGDDESTENGTLLTGSRKPEGREIDYNDYDYKPKNDLSDASYDPDEVGLEVVEEMQVIHPPKARKRKTKPKTRKRKRPSAEPIEGPTKLSRSRNRSQRGNTKKHKTARGPKPRKIQQQQTTNHKIQQQQPPGQQQIQQHTLQQQQQQSQQQQIPKQQDFPNAAGVQYNFGSSGLQKNVPQTAAIDDRSVASPSVYQSNPSIGYGSPQSSNNYPAQQQQQQQQLPSSQLTSYSGQQLYQGQQLPPSQSDFSSSYSYPHGQFKISPLHKIYPNQDVSGRQNPSNQPATYPPIQTQDYYQNLDQYYRSQQNGYQPEVRSNQEFVRPSGGSTHFSYFKQQSPSSSGGISAALEISEPGSYDQLLYNLYNAGIVPFVQPGYRSHAHDKMPDKMFRPPVIIQPSANVSVITGIAPYSDATPYGGYTSALYLNILDGIPHNYPSYEEGDAESVGSYKSEQDGDVEQDGGPVISYLTSGQLNSPARSFNPINLDEYKIPDPYFVKTGFSNLSPSLQNQILQSRIVDGTFKSSGILSSDDNSISSPETEGQLKETGSVDLGGGIQSGSFLNHDVQDLGFRSDNRLVSFPRRKKHEINANGDGIRSRPGQSDSSLAQSGSSLA